jgi:hypothetical protein|tara:strand:+ start:216 stop:326 length:111 start_codon:yes stop_codon:yes gene_type:complete
VKKSFWCTGEMSRDEKVAFWISIATVLIASLTVIVN